MPSYSKSSLSKGWFTLDPSDYPKNFCQFLICLSIKPSENLKKGISIIILKFSEYLSEENKDNLVISPSKISLSFLLESFRETELWFTSILLNLSKTSQ